MNIEEERNVPLVMLSHKPCLSRDIPVIRDLLPGIVAAELSGDEEGSSLCAEDVEVCVREFGPNDIHNNFDIEIIVDLNEFPSRKANLEARNAAMAKALIRSDTIMIFSGIKAFIWTRLMPGAFTEL